MASISQIVKKFVGAPFGNLNGSLVNSIPLDTSGRVNGATWNYGFPQITMTPVDSGGKPPSGMDFNGVFNVLSTILYNSQLGIGANEFNSGESYPMGAIVVYPPDGSTTKSFYISLADNNTSTPTQSNSWRDLLAGTSPQYPDWSNVSVFLNYTTWNTANVLTLADDCWLEIHSDYNYSWNINITPPGGGTYVYKQNLTNQDDFTYFIYPMKAGTILYPDKNVKDTTIRIIGMTNG